jgi:restriction endonuclease Mrr
LRCRKILATGGAKGPELTRLMVRYDVGVTAKETYQLKSVDDDFFEDSE